MRYLRIRFYLENKTCRFMSHPLHYCAYLVTKMCNFIQSMISNNHRKIEICVRYYAYTKHYFDIFIE